MAGIFGRFKSSTGTAAAGAKEAAAKKTEPAPELTPLERMLQNAGPIRGDGNDKFYGMENFGNTCYCNSIVQALYYSIPFRENVVKYPSLSPHLTPNGNAHVPQIRAPNGNAAVAPASPKGITAAEALRRRQEINAGNPQAVPGTRPEDKPDSPEYKKKHAMIKGPIVDLTFECANDYGMEESTFTALKDIFNALITSQSRTGVLSPQRFLEIFKRDNEMFRTSMHQDAHEFYGLVLNAVINNVEDNARALKLQDSPTDSSLAGSTVAAVTSAVHSMGLGSGTRTPSTGWVHDIFEGVLTSETKCLTCETASQRDETFLDLSIDLEEHSSVTSCLRKFSAEEMLCERNKFHCDNCGGLQEAEKRMKIKRLPKILALHLKRFKYTEDMTRLQKLFHRVVYPYQLRMFNTTEDADDPDRLYELYAVVVHIGGNAYHGHYVSVIKTKERGWLLFDDEMVEPVDKHFVRNFFGDKPGMACAYVLFYQETTLEEVQKEQEADGLAEAALATQEAEIALTPTPTGATSIPSTPMDENADGFASLNHVVTAPLPVPVQSADAGPTPNLTLNHAVTMSSSTEMPAKKSKADKEREKKEAKEAEKARKAAEKEKHKAEEKHRKELEAKRREQFRARNEEWKQALDASRQSAAEDDARRRLDGDSTPILDKSENGLLSRNHKGHKSMSRKSLGWLAGGKTHSESTKDSSLSTSTSHSAPDAADVSPVPQLPERFDNHKPIKHEKSKDRFSFGLGKKKGSMVFPPQQNS